MLSKPPDFDFRNRRNAIENKEQPDAFESFSRQDGRERVNVENRHEKEGAEDTQRARNVGWYAELGESITKRVVGDGGAW